MSELSSLFSSPQISSCNFGSIISGQLYVDALTTHIHAKCMCVVTVKYAVLFHTLPSMITSVTNISLGAGSFLWEGVPKMRVGVDNDCGP